MRSARKKTPSLSVTKPLAAYRLGNLSYMLRYWQQLFWENPLLDGTDASLFLAVERLDDALIALADEVNAGVLSEIRRELKTFERFHDNLVASRDRGDTFYGRRFGDGAVPGEHNWSSFRSLADRAFIKDCEVVGWFRLGAVLGKYHLEIHRQDDGVVEPDWMEVVRVVGDLPVECQQHIPELREIVDCSPRTRPLHSLRKVLPRKEFPQPLRGRFAIYDLSRVLFAFDDLLQGRLKQPVPIKPRWDGRSRKLLYGTALCKQYRRPAPFQELVLAKFEALKWPPTIPDPLPAGKLADTIKDMQKAFRGRPITFGRDGTGTGIKWRLVKKS